MDHPAVAGHESRLAGVDPLLPLAHPLPERRPDDVRLAVNGAVGLARIDRPDPAAIEATWGAAEQHRLVPRVGGPDLVPAQPGAAGPDTEALRDARWTPPVPASRCCTTPG